METEETSFGSHDDVPLEVEMSDAEIEGILRSANHGVLSLADDDDAYSVPMSYGFDPETNAIFFQFVIHDGSRKRSFVERTETASFAVSRAQDDEWFSIVAEGPISAVEDDRTDDAYAAIAESAWFPDLTVFDGSVTDAEFELFQLSAESLQGRKAPDIEL